MAEIPRLPRYKDTLSNFTLELRAILGLTQQEIADYFFLHRSRVAHYESYKAKDKPNIGYLAGLVLLIADNIEGTLDTQEILLRETNKAINRNYRPGGFRDWQDLCQTAKMYRDEQKTRQAKKIQPKVSKSDQMAAHWKTIVERVLGAPMYTKLIGVDKHLDRLTNILIKSDTIWLISVEGLGGLGKTVLADKLVRQPELNRRFHRLVWISAKQYEFLPHTGLWPVNRPTLNIETLADTLLEQLDDSLPLSLEPQQKQEVLGRLVHERPYLIVVDNLETIVDYQALLPELRKLVNPSKILITSRYRLPNYPDLFCIRLSELKQEDAVHLIRHEAQLQEPTILANASDAHLKRIYTLVGGNPLALRLVVGQLTVLSLSEVVENLSALQDKDVDEFYSFIYQQTWQLLDPNSQRLLIMMPLAQDSTTDHFAVLSQLRRSHLNQALRQLTQFSLIDVGGSPEERRYRIHHLTETFLLKETTQWEIISLSDEKEQRKLFTGGIVHNIQYWQEWLKKNDANTDALDREREIILRAISFGLRCKEIWSSVYQLILAFSPYMERRGYWDTWCRILNKASEAASQVGDTPSEANLLVILALMLQRQSRFSEAIIYYRRGISKARQSEEYFAEARAYTNLGFLYIVKGCYWRAEILCLHALGIFESIRNDFGHSRTENHLGLLYIRQQRWDCAEQHLERACNIWRSTGDQHGLMRGYINFSALYNTVGQPNVALTYLRKALDMAEAAGDESSIGTISMNTGFAHYLRGELSKAMSYSRQAETIFERLSDLTELARVQNNLGVIYQHAGKWHEAISCMEASLELWRKLRNRIEETEVLLEMVDCALAFGELDQASVRLRELEHLIGDDKNHVQYSEFQRLFAEYRRSLNRQNPE